MTRFLFKGRTTELLKIMITKNSKFLHMKYDSMTSVKPL